MDGGYGATASQYRMQENNRVNASGKSDDNTLARLEMTAEALCDGRLQKLSGLQLP